jgi:hypothetical protein
VSANLAEYQPALGSECDINVPSQYSTIQAGVDNASSGDTVCVGPGTYSENTLIKKPLRLSGSGFAQSTIDGQYAGVPESSVFIGGHNVILEGFTIRGTDDGTDINVNSVKRRDPVSFVRTLLYVH